MTIEKPLYLQTQEYSARADRFLTSYLFTEGVTDVPAGELRVTQRAGGPEMSVDVAAGTAVIDGDDIPDQGAYLVRVTAAENVTIPAPPASNSRIDLVVLQVRDSTATGGEPGLDGATLEIVPGTPAASPVAPATPDTALVLARVTVAAGALSILDANITDQRTQVNKADIAIGTQAEPMTTATRDALTGGDLFAGRVILNTTDGALQTYGGASLGWVAGRADVQTFIASGTWVKPSGAQIVHIKAVGAGGGGVGNAPAYAASFGAGGGGALSTDTVLAANVTATVAVTIGAGGTGSPNGSTAGTTGGASSFGSYVTAYGGGGGSVSWTGGGGGGTGGPGLSGTNGYGGPPARVAVESATGGGGGAGGATNVAGYSAEYGGGGGAGGITSGTTGFAGGSSIYGAGGGGGAGYSAPNAGAAGGTTGSFTPGGGGAGGAAGQNGTAGGPYRGGGGGGTGGNTCNGGAGGAPGGGGGAAGSRASGQGNSIGGTGGRGEVQVLCICL